MPEPDEPTGRSRTPAAADAGLTDEERIYDAFLAAALAGDVPDPARFLEGHAGATESLRVRLEAIGEATDRARADRAAPSGMLPDPATRPAEPGLPFERLGEFRLLRRLDEGGMGEIYLAEQESLGRVVALKVLRPELRGSPTAAKRLEREALAVARLDHPHIVPVLVVGDDRGVRFIAMPYVEGRGLDRILEEAAQTGAAIPASDVLRWGAQIARALSCAHAASIVHRDVKPSNVRITPDGRAMLLDFGIARALDAPALTLTGPFVGTPLYAAPEQLGGVSGEVGPAADVYGLGVTLYEALAGRPPFDARTTGELLHRVLAGDAPPLRRRAPAVSRDLDVVVRKAMARLPSERYAAASDLADDLEAILAYRPVRARPPGAVARLSHWARRRPALAAMAATGAAAALAGAALVLMQARGAQEARRADARGAVRDANERIAGWRAARESSAQLEKDVRELGERLYSEYLSDADLARLDEEENRAASLRRERESAFYEAQELLARAQRLDPEVGGVSAARAALYLERWREAEAARDRESAEFYRDLVLRTDPDGPASREMRATWTVRIVPDAPGTEAFVFRYREHRDVVPGGEPRLVPVPVQDVPPAVTPGTHVLVVTAGAGDLRRGDLVLAIGGRAVGDLPPREAVAAAERGGVEARVHRDGEVVSLALPAGLRVGATAAPLALSPACRRAGSPEIEVTGEPGEILLLLRAPGREDLRVFVVGPAAGTTTADVTLDAEGASPAGFVRVRQLGTTPSFWIQEREVTAADYLEFLDDPATLAEIAASPVPTRFPRDGPTANTGGFWTRGSDGRFTLPANIDADSPVLGVSRDDAEAYADWFGRRTGAAARGLRCRLPVRTEWVTAAGSSLFRRYPFGETFRPRWASSCYSRPQPGPEPVLSRPVDESPFGVFGLSGGAREWTLDGQQGLGRLCGGSWAIGKPEQFEIWFAVLVLADRGYSESGFRLVAVPAEDGR